MDESRRSQRNVSRFTRHPDESLFLLLRRDPDLSGNPGEFALRRYVRLIADHTTAIDASHETLVYGIHARALTREYPEEAHQVLFVQEPEPELHHRFLQLNLSRIKIGVVGIGFLRANLVVHTEEIRLLVRQAQPVEPIDTLLCADESTAL